MADNNEKLGAEFLLAEFNAIQQRAVQIEQSKSSSVNFYLVIVAATIAGVPGILSLVPKEAARVVLIAMFLFIFVVGSLTLNHSVNQAANIIRLYRCAGKIRRYFLDHASDIKAYLPFEANDAFPRIYVRSSLAYRGSEVTVFTINVASAAITSAVIFSFVSWLWGMVAAIVMAGVTYMLQERFLRKKLQRFEEAAKRRITFLDTVE
jgi:hypothetical protein